jgi:hypothetical protein
MHEDLPASFVRYAADILAETRLGLPGGTLTSATNAFAVEYGVWPTLFEYIFSIGLQASPQTMD